ncbi:MAG: cation diffusion facilitator family transporter [Tissierellaceae bacterium]|nr:cation diffusion facilitator family transporter [Tissierellaceae bacterium]
MIKLIIRKFIKNYGDIDNVIVRENYAVLSGILGIINNFILFLVKLTIGLVINSIAVISDAFNNLSDMGTSIVTIFGAKLSNMPPDKEHPYGHGRFEYIASLVVSFIIFAVGLQLLRTSFDKVRYPEQVAFNWISIIILIASISIKLWMFSYNKYIGKLIDSSINRAIAYDSLNDVLATSAVVVGTIVGNFVSLPIDGILGLVISIVIIYSAFTIAKDSVHLILGPAPDPQTIENINSIVLGGEGIKGTHDLIVHDYGPGRISASIHAEVSDDLSIVEIHNEIDRIEKEIKKKLGISIVIHMDPTE